jgi:hypothetical protein
MRLLADENFPQPLVVGLRAGGHDVLWALTDCRGWKDVLLLDLAEFEARIVVTLDKELLADRRSTSCRAQAIGCHIISSSSGNAGESSAARPSVCRSESDLDRIHFHHRRRRDSDAGRSKGLSDVQYHLR